MISRPSLLALGTRVRRSMEGVYGTPRGECYRWSNYVACELLDRGCCGEVWLAAGVLVMDRLRLPHSWVEVGGWVVDITADQFNGLSNRRLPAVWVTPSKAKGSKHRRTHRRRVRHG